MNETVLVTGASSGIGLELAKCFAANGCRLILVARNQTALENLAGELREKNKIEAIVLPADLSQPETPKKIFAELSARKISVDILVNNAGFGAVGAFDELPADRQMEIIQVNVSALTELTRLFLPEMIQRRRGGILNVGSVAGFVAGPGMAVYYASKAFVQSFSEALAAELIETGVTVSVLCPGPTATNFGNVAGSKNVRMIRARRMMAEQVALEGYAAFRRGKVVAISGIQNKLLVILIKWISRSCLRKILRKFNGFQRKS